MEESHINDFFIEHFVQDNILQDLIESEESLKKLCYYLKWKCKRVERNLAIKSDFKINRILDSNDGSPSDKKEALKWALSLQSSKGEFIRCLKWFNKELGTFVNDVGDEKRLIELYCLSEALINSIEIGFTEFLKYVDFNHLKLFLLKLTTVKPNIHYYASVYDTFLKYFDEIISIEPCFIKETINYSIQNNNMDFLCIVFNRKLLQLVEQNILEKKEVWSSIRDNISGNSIKKKQSLSILITTLEFLKINPASTPNMLRADSFDVWDLYFSLLDISKEKPLHLIKPILKLLPSISSLDIMWQISLYKVLLNHSQNFVIYKTIQHLLDLKFETNETYIELLRNILSALNRNEYSDLSQDTHVKLNLFCSKMDEKWCNILFEEFININWNPIAAWCVLRSITSILSFIQQTLIKKMLRTFGNLPHPFIRSSCIFFFLQKIFEGLRENLLPVVFEVGEVLMFTEAEIDEEIFEKIVELNRDKFEGIKDELRNGTLQAVHNNNEKLAYIHLKLLKTLEFSIIFDEDSLKHSDVGDIIVMLYPKQFGAVRITNYILTKTRSAQYNKYLSRIPDKFLTESEPISSEDYKTICNCFLSCPLETTSVDGEFVPNITQVKSAKKSLDAVYLRNKWWISMMKLSLKNSKDKENIEVIVDKFKGILETGDDRMFLLIVENLDLLTKNLTTKRLPEIASIFDVCLRRICELPSSLLKVYSEKFFRSTLHSNVFSAEIFLEYLNRWCSDSFTRFFSEYEGVMVVILEKFRDLILLKSPNLNLLLPFSLTGIVQGVIIQKTERVEFEICQDIHNVIGEFSTIKNPNIKAMQLKMLAMETMYLLAKTYNSSITDEIVKNLLDLYQKHYGKRYFQESKIHLEKLRIVQTLLILVNFIRTSKNRLIDFILDSFCEETHQLSIKQLLQWLLIILMSSNMCDHLKFLIEKINKVSLAQPSSVVSSIPVLYHLLLSSNNAKYWYDATDALLSWTMGANFKLRVYSQATLRKLLEVAEQKGLTEYLEKYNLLLKPITKVLEATGNAAEEILKSDVAFIESFDPKTHYSVENIFITLPKIDVPSSEWKNITEYKFSTQFDIKIRNSADISNFKKLNVKNMESEIETTGMNMQKKIIPWKYALEECVDNKNLSDLIVVASLLEKPSNLGGLSRTCEVFSVKQFVIHNIKIKDDKEFKNLSMSSENWVNFLEVKREDLSNFLNNMKQLGYSLIGLEQTFESIKLNDCKFDKNTVLILGNEKEGIPAPILTLMDKCVEIPQFGQTRSLNVHVAAATCIWEYVGQHFLNSL